MDDLVNTFSLSPAALGNLTSAVQFGFISGTLVFAILSIADRNSPSKVFFVCALIGAVFNASIVIDGQSLTSLIALRFTTGFFLAGIYPVGMKIAADYFDKGLSKSLGFLVGALVLGTAFPHLLKGSISSLPWRQVIVVTSGLASLGGLIMMIFVPDGPYRSPSQKLDFTALFTVFKKADFRAAAFGYFGHMWELYSFWAFVPFMLLHYTTINTEQVFNIPLLSFIIIGLGGAACMIGAYISESLGTKRAAWIALLLSGTCCLISPLMFQLNHGSLFITFLIFWGLVVIADSPLFSTLVAQNAPAQFKGTALTIVNCIGFSITIISIQLLTLLISSVNPTYVFLVLALGPVFGLASLRKRS